jgi:hypothetical protein
VYLKYTCVPRYLKYTLLTLVPWGCCLVPVPQGVLTSVLAPWCRGLMPVRKAADKWLSLGENRVPTSARRQADELELDFLRHGSAPFGYFVRGPGVLGTAPTRLVHCAVS